MSNEDNRYNVENQPTTENGAANVSLSVNLANASAEKPQEPLQQETLQQEPNGQEPLQDGPLKDGEAAEEFTGLPIESLIGKPFLAAAQTQQELTAIYVDGIKKLAYKDGESGDTNTLDFKYQRPVNKADGSTGTIECTVNAPLLSLVPVPAFLMDEMDVNFEMEVKTSDMTNNTTHSDVSSTLTYKSCFGLNASITGNVSSDSQHKRETDSSATYKIHARAIQQPASEGMAKLTSLFASAMEPISDNS